ncbi:MAG: hypothetical protein N2484_18940 [Clostridia bacterium]|nr:hypothetical protein [Clostridia bacterium]
MRTKFFNPLGDRLSIDNNFLPNLFLLFYEKNSYGISGFCQPLGTEAERHPRKS